jgi:hypothetical protein
MSKVEVNDERKMIKQDEEGLQRKKELVKEGKIRNPRNEGNNKNSK